MNEPIIAFSLCYAAVEIKQNAMKTDQRLWRVLHVLLHMSEHHKPLTSQEIAKMLDTNPVVVRRIMAGLRNKGYLQSEKGHGGGWRLLCSLDEITLLDVYEALGQPSIFALGPAEEKPNCLVEQAVNTAIDDILEQSRQLLLKRFAQIPVAHIQKDFERLYAALPPEQQARFPQDKHRRFHPSAKASNKS